MVTIITAYSGVGSMLLAVLANLTKNEKLCKILSILSIVTCLAPDLVPGDVPISITGAIIALLRVKRMQEQAERYTNKLKNKAENDKSDLKWN